MARPGEIEVFRITPRVGLCYQHVEATRSVYLGRGEHKYFSINEPRYVGKFVREVRTGWGDGGSTTAIFDDNGKENRVEYSYEGNTCFIEIPCINKVINSKARNQALRNVYETITGESATPGLGPANVIRSFADIKVPKGAQGGFKKRKTQKLHKKSKKAKKSRGRK